MSEYVLNDRDSKDISAEELSKLRAKALNRKIGALKRKYKMGKVEVSPGDFIKRMNEDDDFKSAVQALI